MRKPRRLTFDFTYHTVRHSQVRNSSVQHQRTRLRVLIQTCHARYKAIATPTFFKWTTSKVVHKLHPQWLLTANPPNCGSEGRRSPPKSNIMSTFSHLGGRRGDGWRQEGREAHRVAIERYKNTRNEQYTIKVRMSEYAGVDPG
jgi:hypothetical protein